MNRLCLILLILLLMPLSLVAQEVLLPAGYQHSEVKASAAVKLPFFDDFSNYQGAPRQDLWASTSPFVSSCFGNLPPTVGTVTLDAIDADGCLHPNAGISTFGGDTLLSQPIRLDSVFSPVRRRLQPSDSVYLSFFYLPGGGSDVMWEREGDTPEPEDSLILEFYNPQAQLWDIVWSTPGICVDTLLARTGSAWQFVAVAVKNAEYLSSEFRFRFRNLCSLENTAKTGLIGNSDHWHLDYVYLNYDRTRNDKYAFDVAFVNPAPSMLKRYQAMPARQYRASEMKNSLEMTITNRYTTPVAVRYTYDVLDADGNELYNYDGGNDNTPCFFPNGAYQTAAPHAEPGVNYQFPVSNTPQSYDIRHVVRGSVTNDDHPQNDTLLFHQVFDDYYAYDDGTAENGFGVTSTSSKVRLACSFDLNQRDSLTAVDLYFNRTRNDENADIRFYLCVWSDNDGRPGTLIYRDEARRSPQFAGLNTFVRYVLDEPVVASGTIYVGIEQTTNDYLNLGFDRSNDARSHIFYNASGNWQQTVLRGALMLRPYFGHKATVGISAPDAASFSVYPNPAHGQINVLTSESAFRIEVIDTFGRIRATYDSAASFCTSGLQPGLYLIRLTPADGRPSSIQKIIIR